MKGIDCERCNRSLLTAKIISGFQLIFAMPLVYKPVMAWVHALGLTPKRVWS